MTAAEIAILLRLRDELSEPLKRAESAVRDMGTAVQSVGQQSRGLSSVGQQLQSVSKQFDGLSKSAGDVGKRMSLGVTAPVTAAGLAAIKAGNDFESAFAGVIKTVDASDAELAELREGIRAMARNEVPASAAAIAGVAEAAGQLGIQNANILEFTRVMIDLGEATNLSATEAATALARFANITGMSQGDFDRLGSVIVALGNNFATTESEIVSMGLRLAGAGAQIGLTEGQIMAFATALSSVGIEAEAGGSAFSKLWIQIAQAVATGNEDLAQFASVAGMTAQQFQQAFEQDAASAIIAFIAGLNNASMSGENLFQILEDLGITEVRMRDAVLRSAGAHQIMTDAIRLQGGAWEDNSALTTEATQRYETFASQLGILRNQVVDVGIAFFETLRPMLLSVVGALSGLAEGFRGLDADTRKFLVVALGIVAAIGPMALGISGVAAAIAFLVTPVGLVVLGLAALGIGLAALVTYSEDARRALDVVIEVFRAGLPGAIDIATGYIKTFAGGAIIAFETVKGAALVTVALWQGEFGKIPGIVEETAQGVQRGAEMIAEGVQQVGEGIIRMVDDVDAAMQRMRDNSEQWGDGLIGFQHGLAKATVGVHGYLDSLNAGIIHIPRFRAAIVEASEAATEHFGVMVTTEDVLSGFFTTQDGVSHALETFIIAAALAQQGVDDYADSIAGLDELLGGVAPTISDATREAEKYNAALARQAEYAGIANERNTAWALGVELGSGATAEAAFNLAKLAEAADIAWAGQQNLNAQWAAATEALGFWETNLTNAKSALEILDGELEEHGVLSDEQQRQYDILTDAVERYKGGIEDSEGAVVDAAVAQAEFIRTQDELRTMLDDGTITAAEYARRMSDLTAETDPATSASYDLAGAQSELVTAIDTVIGRIRDLLIELGLIDGKSVTASVNVQFNATGDIAAIEGAGLGTLGSGITAYAEGGIIDRPVVGLIGEKGPELILPLTDRARMIELMQQAGLLRAFADGGIVGGTPPPQSGGSAGVTIGVTVQPIDWSFLFAGIDAEAEDAARRMADHFSSTFSDIRDIASGAAHEALQQELIDMHNLRAAMEQAGVAQAVIDAFSAQIDAKQAEFEALGALMGTPIIQQMAAEMQAELESEQLRETLRESTKRALAVMDGSAVDAAKRAAEEASATLQYAIANDWPADQIAALKDMEEAAWNEYVATMSELANAAAAGLVAPEVMVKWGLASEELFQVPIDRLAEVLPEMQDGGARMIGTLADAVRQGSASYDAALGLITDMTGEHATATLNELQRLEQALRQDLARALIEGTDPSEIEANLAIIQQLIADLGITVSDTAQKIRELGTGMRSVLEPPEVPEPTLDDRLSQMLGFGVTAGTLGQMIADAARALDVLDEEGNLATAGIDRTYADEQLRLLQQIASQPDLFTPDVLTHVLDQFAATLGDLGVLGTSQLEWVNSLLAAAGITEMDSLGDQVQQAIVDSATIQGEIIAESIDRRLRGWMQSSDGTVGALSVTGDPMTGIDAGAIEAAVERGIERGVQRAFTGFAR